MPETLVAFALALRIASVIQGEGGIIGRLGMVAVADTMLARREKGQSWDEVLSAYYGMPGLLARRVSSRSKWWPTRGSRRGCSMCFPRTIGSATGGPPVTSRSVGDAGHCTWPGNGQEGSDDG